MKYPALLTLCVASFLSILTSCQKESDVNQVPIANAGNSRSVRLPQDTIILHGHGEDLDGKITGYLWSKISGPNTPVIHNNGSDSAVIQGLVAGEYIYQFMVIDDLGATGIDTVKFTVLPVSVVSLSFQPANNSSEIHIWGNSSNLEGSGPFDEMGVAYWTYQGGYVGMRAAFKFDLASIPTNATIISAKLSLYSHPNPQNGDHIGANSGSNNAFLIQQVTSSWTTNTVKWINQPPTTSNQQIVIPSTNLAFLDVVDINVKDMVSSMVSTNSNYGFLIKLQTESLYNSRVFCTSRYSNAAKRPKLDIVYQNN